MRRAPAFWSRPPGVLSALLAPAAGIWSLETARRLAARRTEPHPIPVICAGNLTAGGTGKTPLISALLMRLGPRAHAVTRGYGGRLEGPIAVNPNVHSADDVGDEPLLLAAFGPTWVARDRASGIAHAAAEGAELALLDDGFQSPGIRPDLGILTVDAVAGFGNRRVIPAGPLREPIAAGLVRADMVLVIGPEAARAACLSNHPELAQKPVLQGELKPLATGMIWQGLRCVAFAGIGRPEKMFATLRGMGAEVVATHAFADHAPYSRAIINRLLADAAKRGAQLVTTEKDAVRIPVDLRPGILALPVRLELEDWGPLDRAIAALNRS